MKTFVDLSALNALIGNEITAISTSHGVLDSDSLSGMKIDLSLHINDKNISFFGTNYRTGFIEDDNFDVFYDFRVQTNTDSLVIDQLKVLNVGVVAHIKVYHREFQMNQELRKLPWVQKTFGSSQYIEDLFLINFESKKKLLVAFHPFYAGVEAFFTSKSITQFFEEYGDLYQLSHEIGQ